MARCAAHLRCGSLARCTNSRTKLERLRSSLLNGSASLNSLIGFVRPNWFKAGRGGPQRLRMKNPFRYFNSSPAIMRLTVMMYIGVVRPNLLEGVRAGPQRLRMKNPFRCPSKAVCYVATRSALGLHQTKFLQGWNVCIRPTGSHRHPQQGIERLPCTFRPQ